MGLRPVRDGSEGRPLHGPLTEFAAAVLESVRERRGEPAARFAEASWRQRAEAIGAAP